MELPNTIEGMVSVNDLGREYFVFDEEQMELRGEISGNVYRLGQKVRVTVAGTDRLNRTIDFVPSDEKTGV